MRRVSPGTTTCRAHSRRLATPKTRCSVTASSSRHLRFRDVAIRFAEELFLAQHVGHLVTEPMTNPQRGFVDLFVMRSVANGAIDFSFASFFREHSASPFLGSTHARIFLDRGTDKTRCG